ncbi:MAG TPA: carboxypeptidase-like regulatory domain-containing protein [Candidatus Deferrimicrobium sp.]|nr:carboxypeptidase-like regulatory domain-containing protein [Candidatus Deferrimicrobium sp.]
MTRGVRRFKTPLSTRPLLALLIASAISICFCDYSFAPTIAQGIWGRVEFREGNFMPGSWPRRGSVTYVQRRIFIFEKTHDSDVVADRDLGLAFFKEVRTDLIAEVNSNSKGYYQVELPAGTYSLFVEEQGRYYADRFDGYGYIFPVTVHENNVLRVNILIDYKAFY